MALGRKLARFQKNNPGLTLEEKQGPIGRFQGVKGLDLVGDAANASIVCTDSSVAAKFKAPSQPSVKKASSAAGAAEEAYQEILDTGDRGTLGDKLTEFQANAGALVTLETNGAGSRVKGLKLVGKGSDASIVCTDSSVKAAWDTFQEFAYPTSPVAPEPNNEDSTAFLSSVIALPFRYPEVTASLAVGLLMACAVDVSFEMGVAAATAVGIATYKARYGKATDDSADEDKDADFSKKM